MLISQVYHIMILPYLLDKHNPSDAKQVSTLYGNQLHFLEQIWYVSFEKRKFRILSVYIRSGRGVYILTPNVTHNQAIFFRFVQVAISWAKDVHL